MLPWGASSRYDGGRQLPLFDRDNHPLRARRFGFPAPTKRSLSQCRKAFSEVEPATGPGIHETNSSLIGQGLDMGLIHLRYHLGLVGL